MGIPLSTLPSRGVALRAARLAAVGVTLFVLQGCAIHVKSLPSPEEFHMSADSLYDMYPELGALKFEFGKFMFSPVWKMPYTEEFVERWGEPKSKGGWSSWNLLPFTALPPFHPMTTWEWEFGDKTVTATIDHPVIYGYEPHVWYVTIEPKEQASP